MYPRRCGRVVFRFPGRRYPVTPLRPVDVTVSVPRAGNDRGLGDMWLPGCVTSSCALTVGVVGDAACGWRCDAMKLSLCWECETETERPVVVLLQGPSTPVGRLSLCTACVAAHYETLAADPDLASLMSIQDELDRVG